MDGKRDEPDRIFPHPLVFLSLFRYVSGKRTKSHRGPLMILSPGNLDSSQDVAAVCGIRKCHVVCSWDPEMRCGRVFKQVRSTHRNSHRPPFRPLSTPVLSVGLRGLSPADAVEPCTPRSCCDDQFTYLRVVWSSIPRQRSECVTLRNPHTGLGRRVFSDLGTLPFLKPWNQSGHQRFAPLDSARCLISSCLGNAALFTVTPPPSPRRQS